MQDVPYDSSDAAAAMGGAFVFIMAFYIAICLLLIVCNWIIYEKAGKPGWASIVPVYNIIVMLEIVGKPWWYIFLFLIPIYGWIILPIILTHDFSKSFGKDIGFTVGLLLLPFIFYPILAFSKDIHYIGPAGRPAGPALDNEIGSIGKPAI